LKKIRKKLFPSAPLRLCVSLFFIFLLIGGCKSTPELAILESGVVPLDNGAAAYVLIDVAKARPILENISYIPMTDKNIKQMLDKTKTAVLAVYSPSSVETRRFQLVSWGSYPASGSSLAFGSNKDWTKQRSSFLNSVYWHSEKSQMSVAVTPTRAYVLAAMTKDPRDPIPLSEGVNIPEGFGDFVRGSVLSCWLSDSRSVFNQKLREIGVPLEIPAEQFFVRVIPAEGKKYEAHIKITVPSVSQARAVVNMISLARAFMPAPLAEIGGSSPNKAALLPYILFTNPVVQEGASVIIRTPSLGVNEIALLFSLFSL
jgi:hypothetical protein